MIRFKKIAAAVTIAAASLLPLGAGAQVALPDYTPNNAAGILSISDSKGFWTNLTATPPYKNAQNLINTPAVKEELDFQEALLQAKQLEAVLGFSIIPDSLMVDTLKGIDMYVLLSPGAPMPVGLSIGAEFNSRENLNSVWAFTKATYEEQGFETRDESVGEGDMLIVEEAQAYFYRRGTILLAATSEELMTDLLDDRGYEALAANSDLSPVLQGLSSVPGNFFVALDAEKVKFALPLLAMQTGQDFSALAEAELGVFGLRADVSTSRITAKLVQKSDTLASMELEAGDLSKVASFLPDGGFFASVNSGFTLEESLTALREQLAANFPDPTFDEQFEQGMKMAEQLLGLSLENDVYPAFGDQILFGVNELAMVGFMVRADLNLALKVADKDKAIKVSNAIERYAAMSIAEMNGMPEPPKATVDTHKGVSIRTLPIQNPLGMPLALAHAITPDNYWVVSLSNESLRSMIDRHMGGASSLASNPVWSNGPVSLQSSNFSVIGFSPIADTVQTLAPMMAGALGGADQMAVLTQLLTTVGSLGTLYTSTQPSVIGSSTDLLLQF